MKTRTKIILIIFSILIGFLFIPVEWGTMANCRIANNNGIFEPCLIYIAQIIWPFPPHMSESECDEICSDMPEIILDKKSHSLDLTSINKVLDYCKQKGTGVPMHQPGLSYSNDTHYIDNNTCEWQERKFVMTTPFGYPRDHEGNFDHCFSYKTDPEYGVEIKNSTHILNGANCEWELKNEN